MNMKHQNMIVKSFLCATGAFAYIGGVVWILSNAGRFVHVERSPLIPVFMLLLFVISATVMGLLVLGKPIMMYLSGQKKEAVTFLIATVGWMALFLMIVGSLLVR